MSTLKSARSAQNALTASFRFTMADNMIDVNGVKTSFNAVNAVFEPIPLPINAIMVNGDMTVDIASDDTGATATISVGDSINPTRYLAATSIKAAGRTALTLTGYKGSGENLRITLANANGNAVNGQVSLRASYIIDGRATEVVIV